MMGWGAGMGFRRRGFRNAGRSRWSNGWGDAQMKVGDGCGGSSIDLYAESAAKWTVGLKTSLLTNRMFLTRAPKGRGSSLSFLNLSRKTAKNVVFGRATP